VLRRKRKLPTKVFVHQEGCPIAKVEPAVEILSSYEDKVARHLGRCEYIGETAAGMLRVLLTMTDKGDDDWVECGACGAGWQVPHYGESVVDGEPGAATRVRHP
jgi:hypothetical protein